MIDHQRVVAAIPNFNMAGNLPRLLGQVLAQNYDAVFVLDDASTDDSEEVVRGFGGDVTFVRSRENRGAGANRNQIIDQVDDGVLIHFIDADMELQTQDCANVARDLHARYAPRGVGLIGGLVTRADGVQEPHNYGAPFSLWGNVTSGFPLMIDRLSTRPALARTAERVTRPLAKDWPNLLEPPVPTETYWLHEGNLLIESSVLRSLGGYDPQLRSHEAQDLAIRLEASGLRRQFDPALHVLHHHIDVRGKSRGKWEYSAARYLIRKHGVYRWLTDR
ncbi:glycosyltransferase family 2 protein [Mycolicibacterium vaccae]|uniref:glycosyltransferase family 2 protein n=1 Tax=Mycolicibacterium vaccae TaxID=1810 RepID=UPI003D03F944